MPGVTTSPSGPAIDGPVLLIGAGGMLGRAWRRRLEDAGVAYDAPGSTALDVTSRDAIARAIDGRWRTIVNCSAWTDVDGAETDVEGAHALNADAPGHLAERCRETGALLVHYSTDYVFDGDSSEPYAADAPIRPRSVYGATKAEGEARVRDSGAEHLIIRTSWLHAPWGRNFVLTMMRLLRERDEVRVVDDQRGRPTGAPSLAHATARLIGAGARGAFHVCDDGDCTWFDLATRIGEEVGSASRVVACTSDAFPRPAPRPAYSVLDLSATIRLIGPLPHWHDGLRHTIRHASDIAPRHAA